MPTRASVHNSISPKVVGLTTRASFCIPETEGNGEIAFGFQRQYENLNSGRVISKASHNLHLWWQCELEG